MHTTRPSTVDVPCPASVPAVGTFRAVTAEQGRAMTPRRWPARFRHRRTHPLPGPLQIARLMLGGGFTQHDLRTVRQIRVRPSTPGTPVAGCAVTWVGHATVLIRAAGAAVLVDPSWSARLPGAGTRLTPPGVAFTALPPLHAVLLTHDHPDHMDRPTLRRLPREVPMLVPLGVGGWLRRHGFRDVREHDWWQHTDLGALRCTLVPAHHWSGRSPLSIYQSLWGGWVITTGTHRIYHAGDSAHGPAFAQIGVRLGPIDLACLPVGAYAPRWFQAPAHIDPAQAVAACQQVGARRMLPIHWGCWNLGREPLLAPWRRTRQAWAAAGLPTDRLWDLAIGETRALPPPATSLAAATRSHAPATAATTPEELR